MRSCGLALLVALLLLPSSEADERMAIMDIPPWYLRTDTGDGGILIDINDQLFAGAGTPQLQLQILPPRRVAAEMASGSFHWLYWPCHMPTPGFSSLGVLLTAKTGVALPADSAVQRLSDLRGQRVGVWTVRLGLLPEIEQDQAIEKHEINKIDQGLQMLQSKRLAGMVLNDRVFSWHLRKLGLPNEQFRFMPVMDVQLCLFGRQSLPESRRQQLAAQLEVLRQDRRLESILARY